MSSPPAWGSPPARARAAVIAIAAAGGAARLATVRVQSFDEDEAVTLSLLHRSLGGMLHQIPISEQTPPLYYLLAWVWARAFGFGEVGVRSLSVVLGTATIPLLYALGATLVSRRAGVVAAALAAANPLLFWYSQEARSYALLVMLSALALWLLARAEVNDSAASRWGWAVAAALSLSAHYFAAFLVVPEALWLAWRWRARRDRALSRRALPAVLPLAAAIALTPLAIAQRSPEKYSFIALQSLATRVADVPRELAVGFGVPSIGAWEIGVLALVAAGAWGAASVVRSEPRTMPGAALALGALTGLAVVAPVLLAVAGLDLVLTRNFLAALVPALVVLAAGLAASRAGLVAAAALAVLWTAALVVVESGARWQRPAWRQAAAALGPPRRARVIFVAPSYRGARPLVVYLPRLGLIGPAGVMASEIDVIGMLPAGSGRPVSLSAVAAPFPGFHRASLSVTAAYALARFTAARPELVTTDGRLPTADARGRPGPPLRGTVVWQPAVSSLTGG